MNLERARQIAKLRAVGYSQADIAEELGISQQTVSRYLKGINDAAQESGDRDAFIAALLVGAIGIGLLWMLLRRSEGAEGQR